MRSPSVLSATVLLSAMLLPRALHAQPGHSIIIVRDEQGRPMRGAYAPSFAEQSWLGTKRRPAWTVELHFTVSADYPYSAHEIGRHQSWPLAPDTVRIGGRRHLRFQVIDCWCERKYLLVRRGEEMMRIDLDGAVMDALNRPAEEGSPVRVVFKPLETMPRR